MFTLTDSDVNSSIAEDASRLSLLHHSIFARIVCPMAYFRILVETV